MLPYVWSKWKWLEYVKSFWVEVWELTDKTFMYYFIDLQPSSP